MTLAASKVEIQSDSQLVVEQIQREYEAMNERMAHYLSRVESHLAKLSNWIVKRIPCKENGKTDAFSGVATVLPIIESIMLLVYVQLMPSITSKRVHDVAHVGVVWMHPIFNYLHSGEVLEDCKQAYKLCIQGTRFTLINDKLYRRVFENTTKIGAGKRQSH